MMAQEELTMFFYIFFATFLFLIPAALVAAELGSAFADRGGGAATRGQPFRGLHPRALLGTWLPGQWHASLAADNIW